MSKLAVLNMNVHYFGAGVRSRFSFYFTFFLSFFSFLLLLFLFNAQGFWFLWMGERNGGRQNEGDEKRSGNLILFSLINEVGKMGKEYFENRKEKLTT